MIGEFPPRCLLPSTLDDSDFLTMRHPMMSSSSWLIINSAHGQFDWVQVWHGELEAHSDRYSRHLKFILMQGELREDDEMYNHFQSTDNHLKKLLSSFIHRIVSVRGKSFRELQKSGSGVSVTAVKLLSEIGSRNACRISAHITHKPDAVTECKVNHASHSRLDTRLKCTNFTRT